MVKTDRCVKLLKEIQLGLYPYCFSFNGDDELVDIVKKSGNKGEAIRQYYKDKSGKDRFLTNEEAIQSVFDKDAVLYRLAFLKALTCYVLSPVYKIANKDEQLDVVKSNTGQDQYADVILDTVESFGEPIYVKDLENEFMEVCPDVDSIGKYLPLALSKYDGIKLPYRNGCPMNDIVFGNNNYSQHIRKAEATGLITKDESETILVSIWQIIDRVNTVADWIVEMYAKIESLVPSNGSNDTNTLPDAQSTHFSVNKSYEEMQRILAALQKQGFISADTTIGTFYYRMTGMGAPTNDKVKWIRKGKKRRNDISKSGLVYFLKTFANYNVDQTSDCNNKIQEIFGMSLPSSTITRSSTCEYKAEIDNIVES